MSDYLFRRLVLAALLVLPLLTACSSAQYAVMEKFGIHKREILVDRVEDARDSQEDATQQFVARERLYMISSAAGFRLTR